MLVVIGMIAALSGISFPVYKSIQKKVEETRFTMIFDAVERAIDNFETEYNYLPYTGATYPNVNYQLYKGEDGTAESLMTALAAPEDASASDMAANFKRIRFLECSEPKGGAGSYKNGLLVTNTKATLYRPWFDSSGNPSQYKRWRFDYTLSGALIAWPGGTLDTAWMIYDPGPDNNYGTDDDFFKGTVVNHKPGPDNTFGTSDDEYP
jgi:type II secretory pathway pseudopilin PulG